MSDRVDVGNLRVARVLYDFITNEALPGTGVDADAFWAGVDKVVTDLAPRNRELLERRDDLQTQVDRWHRQRAIEPLDGAAYQDFLTEIGYLVPEPEDFTITTANVDDEITTTAGPQLVVPILNARFALNAANARWGSSTTRYTAPMSSRKPMAPKRRPLTLVGTTRSAVTRSSPTPARCSTVPRRWHPARGRTPSA